MAIILHWIITDVEFKTRNSNIVKDKDGDPQIFAGQFLHTTSGKEISLPELYKEYHESSQRTILEKIRDLSDNLLNDLPEKLKGFIQKMGYFKTTQEFEWEDFFRGTKKALLDKQSVVIVNTNAIRTISKMIEHYLTGEEKVELYKAHGVDDYFKATDQIRDNKAYEITLSFLNWRSANTSAISDQEAAMFLELRDSLQSIVDNKIPLGKFFAKLQQGFATYDISVPDLSQRAGVLLLDLQANYGTPYDSVSDAVQRFRDSQRYIRDLMHSSTTSPQKLQFKGQDFYYFPTREEAESIFKGRTAEAYQKATYKVEKRFKTLNPDPFQPGLTDADLDIITQYYKWKAFSKNFDSLMNMLYPSDRERKINALEDAYREELDDIIKEMEDTTSTEVNISEDTIGAEHENLQRSQTLAVKDFISTIKKGDKSGFIRPGRAYVLAAKLLSGLDSNDDLTKNLLDRGLELGGWSKHSDAYMVANAISDLVSRAHATSLFPGGVDTEGDDIRLKAEHTDKLGGYFESDTLYVGKSGKETRRNKGEETFKFYARIMKANELTSREVAIAGQQLVMGSLLSSVYMHFASLKEANFHYLQIEEKDFAHVVSYRSSKYAGIGESAREDIRTKISDLVENGKYDKLLANVLKTVAGEKPKNDERILKDFLEALSLPKLAMKVNDTLHGMGVIANDIRFSSKNIDEGDVEYNTKLKKYEGFQAKLKALQNDPNKKGFISDNKIAVYQVINNETAVDVENANLRKEKLAQGKASVLTQEKLKEAEKLAPKHTELQNDAQTGDTTLGYHSLNADQKVMYDAYTNRFAPERDVAHSVNSLVNNITTALIRDNEFDKPKSIFSKGKTKKYTMHNGSNAWYIINQLVNNIRNLEKSLPFMNLDFYKQNRFIRRDESGQLVNAITEWHDFDYSKTIDYHGKQIDTAYSEDGMTGFFMRQFNGMFVDVLSFNNNKEGTYAQAFPTVASRTLAPAVKIKAMNKAGIISGLEDTIRQLQSRPSQYESTGKKDSYKNDILKKIENAEVYDEDSTILFRAMQPYLDKLNSKKMGIFEGKIITQSKIKSLTSAQIKEIAGSMYENELKQMALDLANAFVDMKIPLHNRLVNKSIEKLLEPDQVDDFKKLANKQGAKTQALVRKSGVTTYAFTAEDLLPIMHVFVANNYLNSYNLVQLTMGDLAYYKNGAEVIKRAAGAHAPGQIARVNDKFAMPEKFKIIAVQDVHIGVDGISEFLKDMGFKGKALEDQLSLFSDEGYDSSDGVVFITPKRRKDLVKGFGQEYGITHISKPIYFGITKNGPVMAKCSALEITDELAAQYPKLAAIRKNMEAMEADEMWFGSSMKEGRPKIMATYEQMIAENGHLLIDQSSMLTLDSKFYRLQHNPYHTLNGTVAYPSQLAYFLNVLEENTQMADKVYKATAAILQRRLAKMMETSHEQFQKDLLKSLVGSGKERLVELLEGGLSNQFPEIAKQAFTQVSAMFQKSVTAIRFNNSQKLVAQSDVGITKKRFIPGVNEGEPGRWVSTAKPLKVVKENGYRFAECILPVGALPKEFEAHVRERIESGEDVFLSSADALAFRIPSSELHSAVALKIVGFSEPMVLSGKTTQNNMIILPKELMPIMGHDFDIDAFFVLQKQWVKQGDKTIYPGYKYYKSGNWKFDPDMDSSEMEEDEFEAYHKNVIINSFLTAISAPGPTLKRMDSPITFEPINKDIKAIEALTPNAKQDYDLSNPLDNFRAFESSFAGLDGTGAFAQSMKGLALGIRSNQDVTQTTNEDGTITKGVKKGTTPTIKQRPSDVQLTFNGKPLTRIKEGRGKLMNLWSSLDSLLNSAIDNVKLQILPRLNIGTHTFKTTIALRALGVDMETSNRFLILPFMKHANRMRTKFEVNTAMKTLQGARKAMAVANYDLKPGQKYILDVDDTLLNTTATIEGMEFEPLEGKSRPESFFFDSEVYDSQIGAFQRDVTLTTLGKDLQDKIARGEIDPANITLVSNAQGRQQFLADKFGIPVENIHSGVPDSGKVSKTSMVKAAKGSILIDDKKGIKGENKEAIELNQAELEKWLKLCDELGIRTIQDIINSKNQELINAMADYALAYARLNEIGESISSLASYLNIIRSLPVTDVDMQKLLNLRSRIFDEDGKVLDSFPLEMPNFMEVNPQIKQNDNVLMSLWGRLQSMFKIHSTEVELMVEKVSAMIKANVSKEDLTANIKESYQEFMLSTLEDTPEFEWDPEFNGYDSMPPVINPKTGFMLYGKAAFMLHMTDMIDILKSNLTDNRFLEALAITKDFTGKHLQMPGIHNMEYDDILELREWFNKLSEVSYNLETKAIGKTNESGFSAVQTNLLRYAMLRYGLQFGTKNFSLIFPAQLLRPVDAAYGKAIANQDYSKRTFTDFAIEFLLKNPENIRTTSKQLSWGKYDANSQNHYDVMVSGVSENSTFDPLIRLDDFHDSMVGIFYWKSYEDPSGKYALYLEIGKENQNFFYNGYIPSSIEDRFNPKVKNFKVAHMENIADIATNSKDISEGDTISVTETKDPLRLNIGYFKVTKKLQDSIQFERANAPRAETIQIQDFVSQPVDISSRRSGAYKSLKKILDKLSNRTGISYELKTNEEMLVKFPGKEKHGAFADNTVYINSDKVKEDTPFHEFIHPFVDLLETRNKEVFAGLVAEIKNPDNKRASEVLATVRRLYKSRSESEQIKEAIVTLAGQYAAALSSSEKASFGGTLERFLKRLWASISTYVKELIEKGGMISADSLGKINGDTIQTITITELAAIFQQGEGAIDMGRLASNESHDSLIDDIETKGKEATIVLNADGTEPDNYTLTTGGLIMRISSVIEKFITRKLRSKEKSMAQDMGDRKWGDLPHDTLLDTDVPNGNALSYDQYVERLEDIYEKSRIKGTLVHKMIQLAINPHLRSQLEAEVTQVNKKGLLKSWEYDWVESIAPQLLIKYGVNLDATLPEEERDKVKSEVTVFNEFVKWGGTIDMLVEHPDKLFSIVDWKSGMAFNNSFFVALLKYGDQIKAITDNPKERAKLQIALYAVLLKMNNPEMQFRSLQVGWVPNEWDALKEDPTAHVEVDSYIPMIEQFFNDPQALMEAGIDSDILSKVNKNGKLFLASEYSSYSSTSINDMIKQGKTVDQIKDIKERELIGYQARIDASTEGIAALDRKVVKNGITVIDQRDTDRYKLLIWQVAELEKDKDIVLKGALDAKTDIGMFASVFGNAGDINNPLVRVWHTFRNKWMAVTTKEVQHKFNIFQYLLNPVMDEMATKQGFTNWRQMGIMTGNYKPMYSWAMKVDTRPGRNKIKRFITKHDGAAYTELSENQRKLLDYMNDTIASYFEGPDAYLKQGVMEVADKTGTKMYNHLELLNRYSNASDKVDLFYGFMPKIAVTDEEMRFKLGGGNSLVGTFSKEYIAEQFKRSTSFYEENKYERWDVSKQALPIKFTGSMSIEESEDYSDNIELIFEHWIQAMEHKKNMDKVYAFGKGVQNVMLGAPEKEVLVKTAAFMDDILTKDIQGKLKQSKYTSKPLKWKDSRGVEREVSIDKLLLFLNKWASTVVMQFKPVTATGNAIQGMILEHRRAAVGSIAKLNGIDGNFVDYTLEDILEGEKRYAELAIDAASGKLRTNKLYMLAKEFDYHPNASMYKHSREFISLRNRMFDASNQFILHSIGEEALAYIILGAQMSHMKLADGRSVLQAYEVSEGAEHGEPILKWTGGTRGYYLEGSGSYQTKVALQGLSSHEIYKMKRVYENQQGSYRREELAAIEVYAYGKTFNSLKRYLHRLLFVGLSSTKQDDQLGYYKKLMDNHEGLPTYEWHARIVEGRYWLIGKAVLATFTAGNMYNEYRWKNLKRTNPEGYQAMVDAMLTAAFFASTYLAYALMFQDTDDDDTTKKFWKRYFVDNPTQLYNPLDIIRNPSQLMPVALTRVSNMGTSFGTMMGAIVMYGVSGGDISKLYTQRGDLRGLNDFQKGIPFVAPYVDFLNKMKNQSLLPWYGDDSNYR
ncbi:MAG TPA: hypothetical protein DCL77_19955 [Prolixibacteraceae bacterium]|nr:hypothetical protein [Prolixibacteraceae bacterium]